MMDAYRAYYVCLSIYMYGKLRILLDKEDSM
jgi:hypothetical protein